MTLDFPETRRLIIIVLKADKETVTSRLKSSLDALQNSFPEFYEGVITHGPFMDFTSDEWFDFHKKVPHWGLRAEDSLMKKLTPTHLKALNL